MRELDFHIAGALMAVLVALCVASAVVVAALIDGLPGLPAAALAGFATFQALRVPIGRTAVRVLDR